MFDWPARMKTFSGFASKPPAARRAMVKSVTKDFIVFD
jgi:hypothetical protein